MYCKNCGSNMPDNAAFCTVCGAVLNPAAVPQAQPEGFGAPQAAPEGYAAPQPEGYMPPQTPPYAPNPYGNPGWAPQPQQPWAQPPARPASSKGEIFAWITMGVTAAAFVFSFALPTIAYPVVELFLAAAIVMLVMLIYKVRPEAREPRKFLSICFPLLAGAFVITKLGRWFTAAVYWIPFVRVWLWAIIGGLAIGGAVALEILAILKLRRTESPYVVK